jgi:hypothetical protein
MAVLSTFRAPSLGRHVHRELLRSVLLDVTPIIAATACHQRNDVEIYSRFKTSKPKTTRETLIDAWHPGAVVSINSARSPTQLIAVPLLFLVGRKRDA